MHTFLLYSVLLGSDVLFQIGIAQALKAQDVFEHGRKGMSMVCVWFTASEQVSDLKMVFLLLLLFLSLYI